MDFISQKGFIRRDFTDFWVEYDCEVYNRNTRRIRFSKQYAGINIRLFFYCVVYCIAVSFVAARVAFYYLLKENFDFLFNSKCKYDNFLRIAYSIGNIKIINICVTIPTLGFT